MDDYPVFYGRCRQVRSRLTPMHVSAARPLLASSLADSVAGGAQVVVQQARSGESSRVVTSGLSSGGSATPARVRIRIAAAGWSVEGPPGSGRYLGSRSATPSTLRSYLNELALGRN
jgi:hypothetical protein